MALVAAYGPHDGRAALVDALSRAWEHWDRLRVMDNPVGYLLRVGQSASRRHAVRPIPLDGGHVAAAPAADETHGVSPELASAVGELPLQQRTVLMLVRAFGWTQRDMARLLGLNPSTVRAHLEAIASIPDWPVTQVLDEAWNIAPDVEAENFEAIAVPNHGLTSLTVTDDGTIVYEPSGAVVDGYFAAQLCLTEDVG